MRQHKDGSRRCNCAVPLGGVALQEIHDEALCVRRDRHVRRERVLVLENSLVGGLHVLGLVRRLADQERVQNDSHAPDIDFKRVPPFGLVALNDFGGDVVRRAADGLSLLVLVVDPSCQSQVPHLDVQLLIYEQVSQLQVTVDHVVLVHVLDGKKELRHEVGRLGLGEPLAALDHLVHALVVTQFQQYVAVLAIFEEVLELAHVLVLQHSMDLDFRLQLQRQEKGW